MSALVIALRVVSLLAFAGMLLVFGGRRGRPNSRAPGGGGRAPVVANIAACGLFFPSLVMFAGRTEAGTALPLALAGCLLAIGGVALVLRARLKRDSHLAWDVIQAGHVDASNPRPDGQDREENETLSHRPDRRGMVAHRAAAAQAGKNRATTKRGSA
jgi:hypothetical protein